MNKEPVDIEVFTSSLCNRCQKAGRRVAQLLKEPGFETITWREIDVVEEIDHAVAMGVLATPAIAIDGELMFTTLPTEQQLRSAVKKHLAARDSG